MVIRPLLRFDTTVPGGGRLGASMRLFGHHRFPAAPAGRACLAGGLTLALALLPSPMAMAQAPPVFATGVEVIAVDVGVVDTDGRPVRGLGPGDFTLTVGGHPRRIVSVEFVEDAPGPEETEVVPVAPPPAPPTDYSTNEGKRAGRLILIAVDQGNIPMGEGRGAIAAAEKLLSRLSPEDRVGLVTIPGPKPRVEFTTDHNAVREAMRTLVGRARFAGMHLSLTESLAMVRGDDLDKSKAASDRECGSDTGCKAMLVTEAQTVVSSYQQHSLASLNMFRSLFDVLKSIETTKTLVLITQGLGEPESGSLAGYGFASDIRPMAELAASARVEFFVVTATEAGAGVSAASNLPLDAIREDQNFLNYGLEALADIARGVVLRGSPELAFERIAREISGHYLLGFEAEAGERDGKNHKLSVKVARAGTTVRAWRSVSLPSPTSPKQQEQSLAASLRSPQMASGIPLRVASFALPDPASQKVRVLVVSELGSSPSPGGLSVAYVLVDAKDHVVASSAQTTKETTGATGPTPFATSLLVEPGLYTLKLVARDHLGRVGRVDHPVNATVASSEGGAIEAGDLLVGPVPAKGTTFRPAVASDVPAGPLFARWDVFARDPGRLEGAEAVVEIASDETAPARGAVPARLASTDSPSHRVVQAVLPVQEMTPGRYVLRVTLSVGGHTVATAHRAVRLGPIQTTDVASPKATP